MNSPAHSAGLFAVTPGTHETWPPAVVELPALYLIPFGMLLPSQPESNSDSLAGPLWLNGTVWSIMGLCYMTAEASNDGGYLSGLGPILLGVAVAGLGMVSNAVLCLWRQRTTARQALAYGIGGLLLAGVFFWAMNELSHFSKIGG